VGQKVSSVSLAPGEGTVGVGYAEASPRGCFCATIDVGSGNVIAEYNAHTDDCRSVDFSPDGRWLLTGGADGLVTLVDTRRHVVASTFRKHVDKVTAVKWHPKVPAFLTSSADRSALLWGSTE
jgi:WD repeat-containing protein 47